MSHQAMEIEPGLAGLVRMCRKQPKVVEVLCGDIYDHLRRHGDSAYLLDIWPTYQGIREEARFWEAMRVPKSALEMGRGSAI